MSLTDELIGQAIRDGTVGESTISPTREFSTIRGDNQPINWEQQAMSQSSDSPATPYGIPGRPEPEHQGVPVSAFA